MLIQHNGQTILQINEKKIKQNNNDKNKIKTKIKNNNTKMEDDAGFCSTVVDVFLEDRKWHHTSKLNL